MRKQWHLILIIMSESHRNTVSVDQLVRKLGRDTDPDSVHRALASLRKRKYVRRTTELRGRAQMICSVDVLTELGQKKVHKPKEKPQLELFPTLG